MKTFNDYLEQVAKESDETTITPDLINKAVAAILTQIKKHKQSDDLDLELNYNNFSMAVCDILGNRAAANPIISELKTRRKDIQSVIINSLIYDGVKIKFRAEK